MTQVNVDGKLRARDAVVDTVDVAAIPPLIAAPESGLARAGRQPPILAVVLGMHRSGTSLCAHVLNALGVGMADTPDVVPSNPRGQWERQEIVRSHDRILKLFDRGYYATSMHDLPLPCGWSADPRVAQIRHDIVAFLKRRLVAGFPIGFKDPRTARLLPMWQEIVRELGAQVRFIVCLRNPAQVARSLTQRDGLPRDIGEYRWFTYMAEVFNKLPNAEICLVEYEHWFADPVANATRLVRFLDLNERWPASDLSRVVAGILDNRLSHDNPAFSRPELPMVAALYDATHRINTDPAARGEIARIVDGFEAFRQLHRPIYRDFEALSGVVLKVIGPALDGAFPPIVSWRDQRAAAEIERLAKHAVQANSERAVGASRGDVEILLRQRAELDAALARAQQAAAVHERTAQFLAEELAAMRGNGATAATASPNGGIATSGQPDARAVPPMTAVAPGQALSTSVAAELVVALIERQDAGLIAKTIELRCEDPAFCQVLATGLFEAGLIDLARDAAVAAFRAGAGELQVDSVSALPGTPIWFRYNPAVLHRSHLILWYQPADSDAVRHDESVAVRVRWSDNAGRVLLWHSAATYLRFGAPQQWQPLVIQQPLWPAGVTWLRFEIFAEDDCRQVALCCGFVFDSGTQDRRTSQRGEDYEVFAWSRPLELTHHAHLSPWPLDLLGAHAPGRKRPVTPNRRVAFNAGMFPGIDRLFFVDWHCFGRRLAAALVPPASLDPLQLVLPAPGSANRLFGYTHAHGIVPLAPVMLHRTEQEWQVVASSAWRGSAPFNDSSMTTRHS
jgi:hypothetical protein